MKQYGRREAYPDTERIQMRVGERQRIHGGPFEIVETDRNPVPAAARLLKDSRSGERWDVIWTAHRPGTWLLHCHIPHHTTNDNVEQVGAGGLTTIIEVGGD